MYGSTELYNALNITAITGLLDAKTSTNTAKALFNDTMIPTGVTAVKKINFFRVSLFNPNDAVQIPVYRVCCRAALQADAEKIAKAIIDNINRVTYHGYFIKCVLLPIIPPQDTTDLFNQPLDVSVYLRG